LNKTRLHRFDLSSLVGKVILALPLGAKFEPPIDGDGGLVIIPIVSLADFAAVALSHLPPDRWGPVLAKARDYQIEDGDGC
jgi:hypothetical protein